MFLQFNFKNDYDLNNKNDNTSDLRTKHNKNEYRKPQSNTDSNNKETQATGKNLNSSKNSLIISTDYPNESNNNTNTKHNIINSERVSQLRRSYRTRNSKKGNEIRQQNTITEKYKRDSIQVTTTERRVRHRKGTVCLQRCKDVYCIRLRASLMDFTHLL